MSKLEAQELAYALTELGDCKRCMQQKVYSLAKDRVDQAAKRLRKLLKVEGEDEK